MNGGRVKGSHADAEQKARGVTLGNSLANAVLREQVPRL